MMGVDGTLWVELRHCGWEIGCYDGCRWDVMGRTKTLWVEIGCYDGCRWNAMGRTKTSRVAHLRHCGWR